MDKDALERFLVKQLIPTDREVGRGAFGRVEEVRIPGALCAAKRIHGELLRTENAAELTSKFVRECQLMSTLRHPHIVQFLGICYIPDSSDIPSLVMEKLDCDLHKLLESVKNIPLAVKKSILTDVANGLVYLHSQNPPIIHRDLTARNVLLNSALMAKIGDMGVARIVNLSPGQLAATMSKGPGSIVYMPPEAMEDRPRYDTSLDVFSFGNLILFTLTQVFLNIKAATYVEPNTRKLCPRSEIDRRIESFNLLESELGDENHPFILLAKQCLQNVPEARPPTRDVVSRLEGVILVPYRAWGSNKMEMIRELLSSEDDGRRMLWRAMHTEDNDGAGRRTPAEHKQLRQRAPRVLPMEHSPSSRLHPHAQDSIKSVSWRKAKRMPWRLESAQSVVLDGNVYVGSGKTVIVYHTEQDEWHQLPNPPQKDFSMAVLNDKLVLVGGMDIHGIFVQRILDKLTVWDQANGNWTHPFPNMPAARYNVSSAGYKGYLILAGGRERLPEDSNLVTSQVEVPSLSVVEILDTSNSQWYRGDPLPFECHAMQSSVIGDTLYMVGGRNRFDYFKAVVWTHLPDLIAKTSRSSCESGGASNKSYCWSMLPPCPYFASSLPFYSCVNILNTIGNAEDTTYSNGGTNRAPLLALGGLSGLQLLMFGELDTTGIVKDVNAYNPHTNRWNKVGELPEVCVGCSCSLLPSGELFVAGGGQFKSSLNSVYCGKFEYNV